ncbi:ABC transporter ATP-binding protein, partial [Kitasatospora sp. NPDC047058]
AVLRARCDAGAAAMMVTHEPRHAAWADRVVFLSDGRIVDEGSGQSADVLLRMAARHGRVHPADRIGAAR